jgi:predicted nucleotidyltransferase component of viral defense system
VKEYIRQMLEGVGGHLLKVCLVREYLQARVLQGFQEDAVFTRWAFLGGTALRFLHSIPRFSEDLDFSTVGTGEDPGFRTALRRVRSTLEAEGYQLDIRVNDRRPVISAFLRFPALLQELGLSPRASQVLSIKVEVDTKPPAGASLDTTIVRRHVTVHLQHHDKSSLLAGKLHALLSRPWLKGRDVYDLIWYLADPTWPEPNIALLNSALAQTGWNGPVVASHNWRRILETRMSGLDWGRARADVQPFLEREKEIDLVTLDNALRLLKT